MDGLIFNLKTLKTDKNRMPHTKKRIVNGTKYITNLNVSKTNHSHGFSKIWFICTFNTFLSVEKPFLYRHNTHALSFFSCINAK